MTDAQNLLAEYVRTGSDSAFRELVTRYVDLVYSTALRLVDGDTHRAQDVSQTVFIDLARQGRTLSPEILLGGWLHRHTCFVAANTMRGERRRQCREREAVAMNTLYNDSGADFSLVAPMLDETINQLGDEDRTAVVLRFFEQRDFRSVGEALGSNEDAARMRVTRALEKLHLLLKHRGITTGAAALGMALSANAVQSAPIGLAAAISAAAVLAGTAVSASTVIAATKVIAMTTLQKTLVTATVVVLAGAGIFEAHQAAQLRDQIQTLQQQQAPLAEQIQQLQRERGDATNQLAGLLAENAQLKSNSNENELLKLRAEVTELKTAENDPAYTAAKALAAKINQLKQRLEETPNAEIPELQLLNDQDWINAANGRLDNEAAYRRALSTLRKSAEGKFATMMNRAVIGYLKNNGGQMPTELAQLQPYFDSSVDGAILQRWEIAPANTVPSLGMGGNSIITQKAPVDDIFDTRYGIGPNGFGSADFLNSEFGGTLAPVYEAYSATHNGQGGATSLQLLPYAKTPEQQAAIQKFILHDSLIKQAY